MSDVARSHARIFTRIWQDADFVRLSPQAKLLYVAVLTQPDLSYCGVLPYRPRLWAKLLGLAEKAVAAACRELERLRFVLVDQATEEAWVRSFMRNDGVLGSPNLLKVARRQFAEVFSIPIREGIREQYGEPFREPFPEGDREPPKEPLGDGSRAHSAEPPAPSLPAPSSAPNGAARHGHPAVEAYVDEARRAGYEPTDSLKGRLGKLAKQAEGSGIPMDLIIAASEEVARRRTLSAYGHILADLQTGNQPGVPRAPRAPVEPAGWAAVHALGGGDTP